VNTIRANTIRANIIGANTIRANIMGGASIIVVVLPLLGLGGCAVIPSSAHTVQFAREALSSVLDDTQELVGGSWENQDDPTARGCVIPLWVEGESYPGLRTGAPPVDVDRAIGTVHRAWERWGYTVKRAEVGEVSELRGRDSVGQLLIFRASSDAMTLQGESECVPVGD